MSPACRSGWAPRSRSTHSGGRVREPFGRCVSEMTAISMRRGARRPGPRDPARRSAGAQPLTHFPTLFLWKPFLHVTGFGFAGFVGAGLPLGPLAAVPTRNGFEVNVEARFGFVNALSVIWIVYVPLGIAPRNLITGLKYAWTVPETGATRRPAGLREPAVTVCSVAV